MTGTYRGAFSRSHRKRSHPVVTTFRDGVAPEPRLSGMLTRILNDY